MFRLRLDIINDLNADKLIEVCQPTSHVIVRHELPNGNPHYHAYVATAVKENTLRQRIKRLDPQLKSTDYSIKICNPNMINDYVQYMFNTKHGNKWEIIDTLNFDNETLRDLIEKAKTVSEDYNQSKSKSNRITIWDMAEELDDLVNEKWNQVQGGSGRADDFPILANHQHAIIRDYTDIAIHVLRKHKKAYDEYLLRKLISTAMTTKEFGKEILRNKMIKNFSTLY